MSDHDSSVPGGGGQSWVPPSGIKRLPRCDNCRFSGISCENELECRFDPPKMFCFPMPTHLHGASGVTFKMISAFPVVRAEQPCGRHMPKAF